MQITISNVLYLLAAVLVSSSTAVPIPAPEDQSTIQLDSYANIPVTNDGDEIAQESPLALELLPPAAVASVPVYYMGSDGVAVPAGNHKRILRKREVEEVAPVKSEDETMQTEETFFLVPSSSGSNRRCLGGRPARAYYARRYHKYPWNYH